MKTKIAIPDGWHNLAREILQDNPVCKVVDFERNLLESVKDEVTPEMRQIHKGERLVYENLFDWIKARFTSNDELSYFDKDGEKYMIYLSDFGQVDGNCLLRADDAWKVIRALARMFKE
jgi:hypothetical protein